MAIAKVESQLLLKLTPDLVALYSVMNGTRDEPGRILSDLWLFPGFYFLSLQEAASEYRQMRGAPQWKASWFPVFANNAGDYYLVSCAAKASRGVIGFIRGEPEHEVEYSSLEAMLETFVECFASGAFFVKRKTFDIDDEKHREIALRLNPGLAVWTKAEDDAAESERRARGQKLALDAHRLLMRQKKPLEALVVYEEAMDLGEYHQSFYVNALYALTTANAKRRLEPARVRRMLDRVLARSRLHADVFVNAAFAWHALGETDKCIACLRKAKSRGAELTKHLADKEFASLADDTRFVALRRAVKA